MRSIRVKFKALFCFIVPLLLFSQYNEDVRITYGWEVEDIELSDDNIFHFICKASSGSAGIKYFALDTLLNQVASQTYTWAQWPRFTRIDTRNNKTAIVWRNSDSLKLSIKGVVHHSDSIPDVNSIMTLSDNVSFSFMGTTHQRTSVSFLNDTLLVAVWAQADPNIYHNSLYGQLFTSSNKLIGPDFKISDRFGPDYDCDFPTVHPFHTEDGFMVVWTDLPKKGSAIYGRNFNLDASPRDSSFVISSEDPMSEIGIYNYGVGMDSLDNILVCFSAHDDSDYHIYYRWLDKNGIPLSDIDTIQTSPYNIEWAAWTNCNISHDGRSAISWQASDGAYQRIFCQYFDSEHSAVDSQFCVSDCERPSFQETQFTLIYKGCVYSFWKESTSIWSSIVEFNNPPPLPIPVSIEHNFGIESFHLTQNYPNPFNPTTTISFDLPEAQNIKLQIFDISGRLIKTLYKGYKKAGHWNITWDAGDQRSGVYIYRMQYGNSCISKKMLLIK